MKSVIERMAEDRTDEKIARFRQNMTLPYGWGRVLDYIGVGWEDRWYDWGADQCSLF